MKKTSMNRIIQMTTILIVLLISSCGLLLQKTGLKNYKLNLDLEQDNINDYQYDFVYLSKLLELGFPKIDSIFPKHKRDSLAKVAFNNLSGPNIKDLDFEIQARKYLSNVHNQHTNIHLISTIGNVFPYYLFYALDNWHLFAISKQQDSLLIGKRAIGINGFTINDVVNKLMKFTFAENRIGQQKEIQDLGLYNIPGYLKEAGIIQNLTDKLKVTFDDSSSVGLVAGKLDKQNLYKAKGKSHPITKNRGATYSYEMYPDQDFGYFQFRACHDKIDVLESIKDYVKPWLVPFARGYVKRQFKKEEPAKLVAPYCNTGYPIFWEFMWELIDSLNTSEINNLVIDLRHNHGGSITLCAQLLYFLTDKEEIQAIEEYAYTSEIYKAYFRKEFEQIKARNEHEIPDGELIRVSESNNAFVKVIDVESIYYVAANRPVFKGNIYFLANYSTSSAASMLATLALDNGIGIIIGTSVGNNPTGASVYTPFKLPNTKANVSIACAYLERPDKAKGKILTPDFWVESSLQDVLNGKDPYLEKAIDLMLKNKASR